MYFKLTLKLEEGSAEVKWGKGNSQRGCCDKSTFEMVKE